MYPGLPESDPLVLELLLLWLVGLGLLVALDEVSFYTNGTFTDLCRGPHVENTSEIGAFKLMRVAGAYWRGNEKNPQMQRLYGVAFATQQELDEYLERLEQAKLRDHRKLGRELDLYAMSPLVGVGLPLFTPRGTILREKVAQLSNQLREAKGFTKVWTPNITKTALYEKSGHWAKFGDELFLVTSQETDDKMALKPMNCPHHTQIYISQPRSYRDMPVRFLETTTDYRDEKTGELGGLNRVRSLTQDDSHVFARSMMSCSFERSLRVVFRLSSGWGTKSMRRSRISLRTCERQPRAMLRSFSSRIVQR
jgi:threonyl-tRNA synthetase